MPDTYMKKVFESIKNYRHFNSAQTLSEKYPVSIYDYYYVNSINLSFQYKNGKFLTSKFRDSFYNHCVYKSPGAIAININGFMENYKVFIKRKEN